MTAKYKYQFRKNTDDKQANMLNIHGAPINL